VVSFSALIPSEFSSRVVLYFASFRSLLQNCHSILVSHIFKSLILPSSESSLCHVTTFSSGLSMAAACSKEFLGLQGPSSSNMFKIGKPCFVLSFPPQSPCFILFQAQPLPVGCLQWVALPLYSPGIPDGSFRCCPSSLL